MPEQVGALSQMNSPAEAMVPRASGGNSMVSDMFRNMLDSSQQKQSYLERQQKAYTDEMEKYAQMVEQSQQPGASDAATWGAMSNAASNVAPTWGNVGAMLGRVGGAYGASSEYEQQNNLKNQAELTKLRQNEVRALESKDQNASLLRAMVGGKAAQPTIKVVDGKLIAAKYNPATGSYDTEVLTGSQDQIKARLYQNFYNKAVENELPNPEEYAQNQTEKTLSQFGGTTVKGTTNQIPGISSAPGTGQLPSLSEGMFPEQGAGIGPKTGEAGTVDITESLVDLLSPEDQTIASRLVQRINANPATAQNDTRTLQKLLAKYDERSKAAPRAAPRAVPDATEMSYIDKPKKAMEMGTAEETGKALGKEHENLNAAAQASGGMVNQLDLLEKLYSQPNMPEGELAGSIQQLRSGLKSLGVDVGDEVGATDLARALATKFALHIRTGEGTNLMPGQMSNYEDQLLQKMAPTLSLTQEGRLALVQYMKETAKSNMRVAHEANQMADSNRGILPSDWRTRRERVMKEEMARLTRLNKEIMSRFQGAK